MRNKAWFLKELQSRIAVLEDAEQQDILAEYAQHIDLRVAGGLTEEEAIQDFGDLDQLASEILEAYHVKPAFRSPTAGVKVVSVPDPRPALKRGCAGVGALVRRLGGALGRLLRRMGLGAAALVRACRRGLRRIFSRKAQPAAEVETECRAAKATVSSGEATSADQGSPLLPRTKRGLGSLFHSLGRFLGCLGRLAWNLVLLLCAVPFAGAGLLCLVGLGFMVVLLFQGYPLAGAVLFCLGGAAFCAGVLGLGSTLISRRPRPVVEPSIPAPDEETGDLSELLLEVVGRAKASEEEENHD